MDNICRIMEIIKSRIPDAEIFIMAFLSCKSSPAMADRTINSMDETSGLLKILHYVIID